MEGPGPVPEISYDGGKSLRYRSEFRLRATFASGREGELVATDVVSCHRFLGRRADRAARIEVAVERVRFRVAKEFLGGEIEGDVEVDTVDPVAEDPGHGFDPERMMALTLRDEVGQKRVWVVPAGRSASPFPEDPPGPCGSGVFVLVHGLLPFAWIDMLPRDPLVSGAEGPGAGVCPALFGGTPLALKGLRIESWDPARGVAEIRLHGGGKGIAPWPGGGKPVVSACELEILDRFDARAGVYLSRRLRSQAVVEGEAPSLPNGQEALVRVECEIRVERVGDE